MNVDQFLNSTQFTDSRFMLNSIALARNATVVVRRCRLHTHRNRMILKCFIGNFLNKKLENLVRNGFCTAITYTVMWVVRHFGHWEFCQSECVILVASYVWFGMIFSKPHNITNTINNVPHVGRGYWPDAICIREFYDIATSKFSEGRSYSPQNRKWFHQILPSAASVFSYHDSMIIATPFSKMLTNSYFENMCFFHYATH